ncbi:MAG TPA: hypothetical protein VEH77_15315 [Roseiarcus sp.]|nr:hypothetical protein [Roseiarcus sp.]
MPEDLDPVEWELVRADIALEKARLKANGDWAKWEAFQAQANARFGAYAAASERMARRGRSATGAERIALWRAFRVRDFSFLMAPFRGRRSGGSDR